MDEHVRPTHRSHPNTDGSFISMGQITEPAVGRPFHLQHFPYSFQIDFSGFGRTPVGLATVEQRCTKFMLQMQQLLIQCGLG